MQVYGMSRKTTGLSLDLRNPVNIRHIYGILKVTADFNLNILLGIIQLELSRCQSQYSFTCLINCDCLTFFTTFDGYGSFTFLIVLTGINLKLKMSRSQSTAGRSIVQMNPALRLFINQYFIINIGLNLYIHISPFKRDFETISCQSQSIKLLLIYEYILARLISFRWDGTDSSPNKHTETHSRKATLTGLTSISILPRRSVRAHFWHLPLTRATFRSRGRRPRGLGSSSQGLQERPRRVWS